MKRILYPLFFIVIAFLAACTDVATNGDQGAISDEVRLKGDHTVYGLACDGCSDSVIVVLRNEGGDPVRYNIVRAMKQRQVFGDIAIGDELAIVVNPRNPHEALEVIDLERLKGTWTFQVLPKL